MRGPAAARWPPYRRRLPGAAEPEPPEAALPELEPPEQAARDRARVRESAAVRSFFMVLFFITMTSILPGFGLKLVRVGDGGTAANGLCRSIKKQPLIPSMGQELHSCDTTQIDVLQRPLASRAITRARWITGGSPSASTWAPGPPFKPPSKVHSPGRAPPRSHHPGLSLGLPHRLLLFLKGLRLIDLLVSLYAPWPRLSSLFSPKENFWGEGRTPPPQICQPRYSPARSSRFRSIGPKVMASSILTTSPGMKGSTHRPRAADTVLSMERQNHAVPKA